ncbi:hypothetical protein BDN67DRAFT_872947, partial [Paxillus ammoniavirescens]
IFTCLVCSFFYVARLGEFTVLVISKFDPAKHITHANVSSMQNHEGLPIDIHRTVFMYDPKSTLDCHFAINPDQVSAHLFLWKHPTGVFWPLSKKEVIKQINTIIKNNMHMPDLKGHSLQIGTTPYYLLKDTPFDAVKTLGRWSSESFTLYL